MRTPILARTGVILIPVFLVAYYPLCELWCHHIETHSTPEQIQNGAYINGFYALDVMIKLAAIYATALAFCSIASLLRREQGARFSLIYGVPAVIVSLAVIGLYLREFVGKLSVSHPT